MNSEVVYLVKDKLMVKTIKQTAVFKGVTPYAVYETLMDSKKHAAFSGEKANISREIGGTSSASDGWIEAINIELLADKKIVQAWRGGDWPKGHYSIATFTLSASGKDTKLSFTQISVPDNKAEDIADGWKEYYWEKMKRVLEK